MCPSPLLPIYNVIQFKCCNFYFYFPLWIFISYYIIFLSYIYITMYQLGIGGIKKKKKKRKKDDWLDFYENRSIMDVIRKSKGQIQNSTCSNSQKSQLQIFIAVNIWKSEDTHNHCNHSNTSKQLNCKKFLLLEMIGGKLEKTSQEL